MAHHDALTGLPNRNLLDDRLTQALAQARRSGNRIALCLIDLDGFKPINDTSATGPATKCCRKSPTGWKTACAKATPWRAGAATNSCCC
jgi:predicted signal transduction protein with EAL and GGDEF domain